MSEIVSERQVDLEIQLIINQKLYDEARISEDTYVAVKTNIFKKI